MQDIRRYRLSVMARGEVKVHRTKGGSCTTDLVMTKVCCTRATGRGEVHERSRAMKLWCSRTGGVNLDGAQKTRRDLRANLPEESFWGERPCVSRLCGFYSLNERHLGREEFQRHDPEVAAGDGGYYQYYHQVDHTNGDAQETLFDHLEVVTRKVNVSKAARPS